MRFVILVVALLLAGCASTPPTPTVPVEVAPPDASTSAVILSPCIEHAADFPISIEETQPFLPEGMRARPIGPTGVAAVEFITVTCSSDLAPDGDVNAFIAWMLVDPPEDLRADDAVAGYLFLFAITTDNASVGAALAALNLPAEVGPTTFGTDDTPAGLLGHGTTKAAKWGASLETSIAKREVTRSHPLFRVFAATPNGIAAIDVDAGSHPHDDTGTARFSATGTAPFPVPTAPGIGVYGWEGHLGFLPIGTAHEE